MDDGNLGQPAAESGLPHEGPGPRQGEEIFRRHVVFGQASLRDSVSFVFGIRCLRVPVIRLIVVDFHHWVGERRPFHVQAGAVSFSVLFGIQVDLFSLTHWVSSAHIEKGAMFSSRHAD